MRRRAQIPGLKPGEQPRDRLVALVCVVGVLVLHALAYVSRGKLDTSLLSVCAILTCTWLGSLRSGVIVALAAAFGKSVILLLIRSSAKLSVFELFDPPLFAVTGCTLAWATQSVRKRLLAAQAETAQRALELETQKVERQRTERDLRASEQRFRQLNETIKEVFWITNVEKSEMIYISPGYESIWGRTCQSLYQNPRSWLEAIHPDDCERVVTAAMTQRSGGYDEQYRIIRPDGKCRWIRDRGFPVYDENGAVYRIAGVADDITVQKEAEQAIAEEVARQRRLENQLLEVSDHEQARIGHDLHDELCQFLVGILFHCQDMSDSLERSGHPEANRAKHIAELVNSAITQARQLARGLFPVLLEQEGLVPALQEFADGVKGRFKTECTVECDTPVSVRDKFIANHLYRIAQEAVNNAARHGRARQIKISLGTSDSDLHLAVTDDGIGIDNADADRGMGLHIMNYRAHSIGGVLEIKSPADAGTSIVCRVPLGKL